MKTSRSDPGGTQGRKHPTRRELEAELEEIEKASRTSRWKGRIWLLARMLFFGPSVLFLVFLALSAFGGPICRYRAFSELRRYVECFRADAEDCRSLAGSDALDFKTDLGKPYRLVKASFELGVWTLVALFETGASYTFELNPRSGSELVCLSGYNVVAVTPGSSAEP